MKSFLKTYRLLNNGILLELFDLSEDEVNDEIAKRKFEKIKDFDCYIDSDGSVLVRFDNGEGMLYPDTQAFLSIFDIGIQSDMVYFSFCPSYSKFLEHRYTYINELVEDLSLDKQKADYSPESLTYIEIKLHEKEFKTRQQVEKYYLGILSYCGECICNVYRGEWYIQAAKDVTIDLRWQPFIKLETGKILDAFPYIHEGLLLYGEGHFLPMIDVRPNQEFVEKRNQYYSN